MAGIMVRRMRTLVTGDHFETCQVTKHVLVWDTGGDKKVQVRPVTALVQTGFFLPASPGGQALSCHVLL